VNRRPRHFSKPKASAAGKRIALMSSILHYDGPFDDARVESLCRCYGASEQDVRALIADKMARQVAR
jgi:hypothetical protein